MIQRVNPDVLLVNEFDYTTDTRSAKTAPQLFADNFLAVGQNNYGAASAALPIDFGYHVYVPSNTGVPSGLDLDDNGTVGGGNDAFGFGNYPGQFGLVIYSKYPIAPADVRTFQHFLWKDMPGALLPDNPATAKPTDWYNTEALEVFRLSSKTHVDAPIDINGRTVHFLASHPTPPVFDGAEDRNGRRNHDEIRFWKDYVTGGDYMVDDQGRGGGLAAGSQYVLAGDIERGPVRRRRHRRPGIDVPHRKRRVPRERHESGLHALQPRRPCGRAPGWRRQRQPHREPRVRHGRLRRRLARQPARRLRAAGMTLATQGIGRPEDGTDAPLGVFWPAETNPDGSTNPLWPLVGRFGQPNLYAGFPTSDHKAVWIDLEIQPIPEPSTWALVGIGLATLDALARLRRCA